MNIRRVCRVNLLVRSRANARLEGAGMTRADLLASMALSVLFYGRGSTITLGLLLHGVLLMAWRWLRAKL